MLFLIGDSMKLILASSSKFKREILDNVGIKHISVDSKYDEDISDYIDVYDYVKKLSLGKANGVINEFNEGIILGLDTVVYVDDKIIEKPNSMDEARNNIYLCKNNSTRVITGITLINLYNNEIITDYVESIVKLRDISEDDINYYFDNEKDAMYASGFIIETIMSNFIENINGSFYNILGMPVETIYKYINKWGYSLKDFE